MRDLQRPPHRRHQEATVRVLPVRRHQRMQAPLPGTHVRNPHPRAPRVPAHRRGNQHLAPPRTRHPRHDRQKRGARRTTQETPDRTRPARGQRLRGKLLGTIDQDFWQERTTAWQHERDELRAELSRNEQVIPHEEFLAAARHPIELLQRAPDLYVTQEPSEKAGLLKTLVSNYTVTDGSLTVTLRSPFDLLAQGGKSKDWWS